MSPARAAPLLLLLALSCQDPPSPRSRFYDAFDPSAARKRSAERFTQVLSTGLRSDLLTDAPAGRLKGFLVTGTLKAGKAEEELGRLKAEFVSLVSRSGARVVGESVDSLDDLPAARIDALLDGAPRGNPFLGSSFRYRQGRFTGTVELAASRTLKHGEELWTLAAMIIEESP